MLKTPSLSLSVTTAANLQMPRQGLAVRPIPSPKTEAQFAIAIVYRKASFGAVDGNGRTQYCIELILALVCLVKSSEVCRRGPQVASKGSHGMARR